MRNDEDTPSEERTPREDLEGDLTVPLLREDLNAFVGRVGAFAASSKTLDRDALMFAAGQASQHGTVVPIGNDPARRIRTWQRATAAMTVVASCLSLVLALRLVPEPRVIIVERDRPAIVSQPERSAPQAERVDSETVVSHTEVSPIEISTLDDDRQLAKAWNARREMMSPDDLSDDRLAAVPSEQQITNTDGDNLVNPDGYATYPFTSLEQRSRKTIERLLEEQL